MQIYMSTDALHPYLTNGNNLEAYLKGGRNCELFAWMYEKLLMLFCYSFKKQMCRCLSVHVDTLWEYSYNIPSLFVRYHRCWHFYNLINTMSHQYAIQFDLQLNELLEEKVRPYIQNINSGALPRPIIIQPQNQDKKVSPSFPLLLWLYL